MDTVEELNGTYFYAGRSNLKASELFFMIFCEKFVEQLGLGVADFSAVVALLAGRNDQLTVSQISYKTVRDYNKIARGNNKVG